MSILTTELLFTGKDGKEYKFKKLDLSDLQKFVTWVQYKPVRDALAADLPEELRKEIYEECKSGLTKEKVKPADWREDQELKEEDLIEQEFGLKITSTVVQDAAFTILGCKKLMEISLEKSYSNYKDILTDEIVSDKVEEFLILIGLASVKPVNTESEENPTNPN